MKKVFFFVAFALLTLASCKKDWTCTCTQTGSTTITDMTKSDAKVECDKGDLIVGGTTYNDCEIK